MMQVRDIYGRCRSGNRDVVGHGINGINAYKDDAAFPFPAIRFKENTFDLIVNITFLTKKKNKYIAT